MKIRCKTKLFQAIGCRQDSRGMLPGHMDGQSPQSVVQEPYKYKATERLKAISELS